VGWRGRKGAATIDIGTTQTTPLDANFGGIDDELVFPAE
jgi:hypothetical protein